MDIVGQGGVVPGPLDRAGSSVRTARPGPAADVRDEASEVERIGVVFVHGIGDQRAGLTLISWARPLVRLIGRWTATTPGVDPSIDPVLTGNIDFSGSTFPTLEVSVPGGTMGKTVHKPQHWVLTESWWAARVSPPSIGEVFRWLVPGEMIRIFRGIVRGQASQGSRAWAAIDAVFSALFMIPAVILAVALYIVFRAFRIIPIDALQQSAFVRGLEFFLVDWFGDVRVLLADRAQAANIRNRVALSIRALHGYGCDRVVIVAHSGGTIVSYMTLTDPALLGDPNLRVDRLITHGQALDLTWRLGHATDPWAADQREDRLYLNDRLQRSLEDVIDSDRETLDWYDFWATHDPAPAGGFGSTADDVTNPEACHGATQRIFNRMSLRGDHGGYWDNDEEFVLPVARLIERQDLTTPTRFFPVEPALSRAAHREHRVRLLSFAWLAVMLTAIASIPVSMIDARLAGDSGNLEEFGQAAFEIISWIYGAVASLIGGFIELPTLPATITGLVAEILGIAFMVGLFLAAGRGMVSVWNRWDARERLLALQPAPDQRSTRTLSAQLFICAAGALSLFFFATSGRIETLIPLAVTLAVAIGWSILTGSTGQIVRGDAT
ncbi:MAG: hypothetical protein K0S97_1382 [Chloroflexota bacterium]|nr:hypothetical protein [Chloroflexota bacterium]